MKDDEIIFNKALESAHCAADECIFIDNDMDNLIIPKKLGIHTIFHDHEKNDVGVLEQELQKLGVNF
jgi:putative hydrolase of the HAD superfamily